jgi:hypothetical protein
MASTPANLPPVVTFDASRWLVEWAENGGIVFMAGDRLYLQRCTPLDRWATQQLDRLRTSMLRSGGGPAIAEALIRRRNGDVP